MIAIVQRVCRPRRGLRLPRRVRQQVDEYLSGLEEPKRGRLRDELKGYTMTKSSLHFAIDAPLPRPLVEKLIAVRLAEISQRSAKL